MIQVESVSKRCDQIQAVDDVSFEVRNGEVFGLQGARIREPNRAGNVGVLLTMSLAALGGCWWPIEVVPPSMKLVAAALPTGWAMTALHRVISFGGGLTDAWPQPVALLALGALASVAASRSLRIS